MEEEFERDPSDEYTDETTEMDISVAEFNYECLIYREREKMITKWRNYVFTAYPIFGALRRRSISRTE